MSTGPSGIVLAGGDGRRLGRDKARLEFNGRPLLDIVVQRLTGICDEVIVACGASERQRLAGSQIRAVADRLPGRGPLAGLQAGLAAAISPHVLVVACDMPFLNTTLLSYMVDLSSGYDAVVPVMKGRQHPLHAVYDRQVLPAVDLTLGGDERSMRALLGRLRVREVTEADVRALDAGALSLFNINTPADLAYAEEIWRRRTIGVAA